MQELPKGQLTRLEKNFERLVPATKSAETQVDAYIQWECHIKSRKIELYILHVRAIEVNLLAHFAERRATRTWKTSARLHHLSICTANDLLKKK